MRRSDGKVTFDARQLEHDNAEWFGGQLEALTTQYTRQVAALQLQGRQQHVGDDRRPSTERAEELLDDYQSSGYSSADDA
jgi:hypothetical protein